MIKYTRYKDGKFLFSRTEADLVILACYDYSVNKQQVEDFINSEKRSIEIDEGDGETVLLEKIIIVRIEE